MNGLKAASKDIITKRNSSYPILVMGLMVFIVAAYTLAANFTSPSPAPDIKPVIFSSASKVSTSSDTDSLLQVTITNPGYENYISLGLAYYNQANYTASIQAWEKALVYNPNSDLAYNNIAAAYGAMNNWEKEIEACHKALAINPNHELAKRNLEWAKKMRSK